MDEAELATRRSQMGRSVLAFLPTDLQATVGERAPGYWLAFSGAPSPEVNVVLVDSGDPAVLAHALDRAERSGLPVLFMLAGACRDSDLGTCWQQVGDMPFMMYAFEGGQPVQDSRVHQAGAGDFEAVSQLLADGFGLTRQVADLVAGIAKLRDADARIWLLVDDGSPVSTVVTSSVDDAECVWCMSTPERFARRGYARSLLAHVLSEARGRGAAVGLLGATPAGKPLYDATGWTTLESWQVFTNAGPEHSAEGESAEGGTDG